MRFELARPFSAARRRAIKFSRTWSGKMPLPDTRMSAPASATTGAVSTLIPPSTWISTARCSSSTYFRAARIFGKTSARNACPENPGWTVMTSSRSTSPRYGTLFSNGVAGFRTTPGRIPASRIARIVARTSWSLSTWTVRSSTPASTKAFTKSCGCVTIRWASNGTLVRGRIDLTMAGPIVRLGTKWPSITSMWSRSAPASDASRTWSPRRSKRADKIEGAILMAIEARKEASWNKISLPRDAGRGEGVSFSGVTRLGSVERCKFGDDLHPADEGHRLHDVSDLAAEPGFGREAGPAALIASEAHHGSLRIVCRQDGRHIRGIEPAACGPERALEMNGSDLFQLREVGRAIQRVSVHRRILEDRPIQQQGRGVRVSAIPGGVEQARDMERGVNRYIVLGGIRGRDRAGQGSFKGRASPRRTRHKHVGRCRVHVVRPGIAHVPGRRSDRRGLRGIPPRR